MPDWGVPDWRDRAAYPTQLSDRLWRWEFVRRDPEYREAWLRYPAWRAVVDGTLVRPAQLMHDLADTNPADRWFLTAIFDPREPAPNVLDFLVGPRYVHGPGRRRIDLGNAEVAVIVDLSRPMAPQIERAKKYLDAMGGRIDQRERSRLEFVRMLRVIDARASTPTPSWAEIAAALWPRLTKTPQQARDKYESAKAMWVKHRR